MSDRTFTITFTERERLSALFAFGHLWTAMQTSPVAKLMEELHLKLANAKGSDAPADPNSGTGQARAILSPPAQPAEPRDYFARDRKGETPTKPWKGVEAIVVTISKLEKVNGSTPRLKVSWPAAQGFTTGSCFDAPLWSFIESRLNQKTTLFVTYKGEYVNVVGVRA